MTGMDSNGKDVVLYEDMYGRNDFFLPPYIIFWDPPAQCGGTCTKNYIKRKLGEISMKNSAIWMVSFYNVFFCHKNKTYKSHYILPYLFEKTIKSFRICHWMMSEVFKIK